VVAGSHPRIIEITHDTTIILNDRLFELTEDGRDLIEITDDSAYQNGAKFCATENGIRTIQNETNIHEIKILIGDACHGQLSIPRELIASHSELQLISTKFSSIFVDDIIDCQLLTVAAIDGSSIVFRTAIQIWNLYVIARDWSYIQFEYLQDLTNIVILHSNGCQIYIPRMSNIQQLDVTARNHSKLVVDRMMDIDEFHLSLSNTAMFSVTHVQTCNIAYQKSQSARLFLPQLVNNEPELLTNSIHYY
jgi:hypothetical protein